MIRTGLCLLVCFLIGMQPASARQDHREDEGPTTSSPVVNQNVTTARGAAFRAPVLPKSATSTSTAGTATEPAVEAAEETADEAGPGRVRFSEVSSDMEYESFSIGDFVDGTNLAIQGGYARTSAMGTWTYGANVVLNSLSTTSFGTDASQIYTTVQTYVNRSLASTLGRELYVGVSLTGQTNDLDGLKPAYSVGLHAVQRHYIGEGTLTYGAMAQMTTQSQDFFGTGAVGTTNTYANLAVLYGLPLGNSLAVNADVLAIYTIRQTFDGNNVDLGDRVMLNPGLTLTWYPSPSFGLNVGAKTVLMVNDYNSIEGVLGARFRF